MAHIVAGWTEGVHLDAIYSSTLSRSRDTAAIVAARRRVESLPELRERKSGRFEPGSNEAEGYLKRRFVEDDDPDGGETPAQFLKRVDGALAAIISRHAAGAI
jgi:broad specificity phosphatase PhoE